MNRDLLMQPIATSNSLHKNLCDFQPTVGIQTAFFAAWNSFSANDQSSEWTFIDGYSKAIALFIPEILRKLSIDRASSQ